MDVKNVIKRRREELGLTMKEVAGKVGVSEGTISRWESGDIQNMKRDKIAALANALHLSPAVIMGWQDAPKHDEEQAKAMYSDSDMRTLYYIKQNMDPAMFEAFMEYVKKMYELANPEDNNIE